MSTRSVVAIGTLAEWKGIYCHWDGYISERGPLVWKAIQDGTYEKLITEHPGGWSSYPESCYCHDRRETYDMTITNADVDPLDIKWVYILDGEILHVLKSYRQFGKHYGYFLAASIDTTKKEPDWVKLDLDIREKRKNAHIR